MITGHTRLAPIGGLVEKVASWNPVRDAPEDELAYIDLSAVDNATKTVTGIQVVQGRDAPSRARQLVQNGDVLVSTVRPNLNGVARVPEQLDGATASTGFCVLRPKPSKLDGSYLFHWVRSPDFVADMVRKATGASYPAVSDKIIEQSEIPLPPLEEQKRIASILDQADELRRKRQRALDRLNQLGQAIFIEMFGDPKTNPKGLPKVGLGELIKVSSGVGLTASNQNGGDYPVYGGNGVNGWHDDFTVPAGTVVIGRVGVYCGAIHVTDRDAWVTDNALIVTLKRPVNRTYLAAALKIADLNQYAGRSAQPLVSGSRIYPIEILHPTIDEQDAFEVRVLQAKAVSVDSAAASKNINGLFSALQHRAFRGEL